MLLLNINTKAYMGKQLMRLNLTLLTLKGQCQAHSDIEGMFRKGAK